MRIYLDNCCYNRPYDDQTQMTISLETQAKLYIQDCVRKGEFELVTSFILLYEISRNPNTVHSQSILRYIQQYSTLFVSDNDIVNIELIAAGIQSSGIKKMDAWHVACAISAKTDYLLTTDKRLLKYNSEKIILLNPIEFISIMEDKP